MDAPRAPLSDGGPGPDLSRLLAHRYGEVRRLAAHLMRGQPTNHTLQATALVHEAFLRLTRADGTLPASPAEFVRLLARVMRTVLIDHARGRSRLRRRAPGRRVPLAGLIDVLAHRSYDPEDLDRALAVLEAQGDLAARSVRVVELRFYLGMSVPDTALALGISPRTVQGDWRYARTWLRARLGESVIDRAAETA